MVNMLKTTRERPSYLNVVTTRLQIKIQKGEGDVMRGGGRDDGHTSEAIGVKWGEVGRVDGSARCCVVTFTHCTIINKKNKCSDDLWHSMQLQDVNTCDYCPTHIFSYS